MCVCARVCVCCVCVVCVRVCVCVVYVLCVCVCVCVFGQHQSKTCVLAPVCTCIYTCSIYDVEVLNFEILSNGKVGEGQGKLGHPWQVEHARETHSLFYSLSSALSIVQFYRRMF